MQSSVSASGTLPCFIAHPEGASSYHAVPNQTPTFPPRERATMTEPPPRTDAGSGCSAWRIHDAYLGEQERARAAEEAAKAKSAAAKRGAGAAAAAAAAADSLVMQGTGLAATVRPYCEILYPCSWSASPLPGVHCLVDCFSRLSHACKGLNLFAGKTRCQCVAVRRETSPAAGAGGSSRGRSGAAAGRAGAAARAEAAGAHGRAEHAARRHHGLQGGKRPAASHA